MSYKDTLKRWAIKHDPFSRFLLDCQQFEAKCRQEGLWICVDVDPTIVEEAAYQGLLIRREVGKRWEVKLLARGREFLAEERANG